MNSEDWKFLMNVSKRMHGWHDGRNHYKYNNNDKEWIDYVEKYANGESDKIHNDKNIDYIEMFYVSFLIGCILFIIISVIFGIKW